jgi:hypothetical protein
MAEVAMRVISLDGSLLNFWVAKSAGLQLLSEQIGDSGVTVLDPETGQPLNFQPAWDWAQGGPIAANEWYELEDLLREWLGPNWSFVQDFRDHPLKWLMRSYVALKFGAEVEDLMPPRSN